MCNAIVQSLPHISTTTTSNCTSILTMEWQTHSSALLISSQSTLGNTQRRHQDWFDENSADIRSLIHNKNAAHDALLRNPTSRTLHERFSSIHATVQRKQMWMEDNWWVRKAAQLQSYANINDVKNSYGTSKGVYGLSRFSLHPVRRTEGVLMKNKEFILARWDEYLQSLMTRHLSADGLHRSLDVMSERYLRAGLIINTTKTEILSASSPDAPTFSINGNQLEKS